MKKANQKAMMCILIPYLTEGEAGRPIFSASPVGGGILSSWCILNK